MKKTWLLVVPVLALAGCNTHKEFLPFLGKWKGGFDVASIKEGGSDADKKREKLFGSIQIYATKQTYKMEMNGEQESIQISGTWTLKGNKVTLKPTSMDIDDKGGAELRDPNKKFIPANDVRAAYSQPLVLTESADKKLLTGLEISIGHLIGAHRFIKDSF